MRGFLHAHPNSSAAFLHRVSAFAKFKLSEDDPRPISHVTLPSCAYFQHRGWNPRVVPLEYLAPGVLRARSAETQGSAQGSLAAATGAAEAGAAGAEEPAAEECSFDMHTLYDASRRCAQYNYYSAPGDQRLPLFEIPTDSHVGRVIAESSAAFRLLREEVAQRGPSSQLFRNSSQPAAS